MWTESIIFLTHGVVYKPFNRLVIVVITGLFFIIVIQKMFPKTIKQKNTLVTLMTCHLTLFQHIVLVILVKFFFNLEEF